MHCTGYKKDERHGGLAGTRTPDQCLKRALLYRLSYQPTTAMRHLDATKLFHLSKCGAKINGRPSDFQDNFAALYKSSVTERYLWTVIRVLNAARHHRRNAWIQRTLSIATERNRLDGARFSRTVFRKKSDAKIGIMPIVLGHSGH
jgi:hypothetical protein